MGQVGCVADDLTHRVYDYADRAAPFMCHCHLLEHEDKGMMGQFVVREQRVVTR